MTGVEESRQGIVARRFGHEFVFVVAGVAAYFGVRGQTQADPERARHNATLLVRLEQAIGIQWEQGLQHALAGSRSVTTVLNWIYIWGHWPVIALTLGWLVWRHPRLYYRTRNAMLLSGAVGLVVFVLFPVAPPRLADIGLVDTVTAYSHSYRVLQPPGFVNQYAAMPSLHVGWDLLMGLAIMAATRRVVVRLVGAVLPVAMTAAVVLTANHYLLDAAAGVALVSASTALGTWWLRRQSLPGGRRPAVPVLVGLPAALRSARLPAALRSAGLPASAAARPVPVAEPAVAVMPAAVVGSPPALPAARQPLGCESPVPTGPHTPAPPGSPGSPGSPAPPGPPVWPGQRDVPEARTVRASREPAGAGAAGRWGGGDGDRCGGPAADAGGGASGRQRSGQPACRAGGRGGPRRGRYPRVSR